MATHDLCYILLVERVRLECKPVIPVQEVEVRASPIGGLWALTETLPRKPWAPNTQTKTKTVDIFPARKGRRVHWEPCWSCNTAHSYCLNYSYS